MKGTKRRTMSVSAYLVLRSIMVFDALLLVAAAGLLAAFMERPANVVSAALCCFCAGASIGGARWLDRMYDGGG
jgi:hypothetical protein